MIKRVVMPKLGLTATEGRIVEWLQPERAAVRKGDPLFVVETEKSNVEIESPADGVLLQARPAGGEAIPFGEVIGFIATAGEQAVPAEMLAQGALAKDTAPPPTGPAPEPAPVPAAGVARPAGTPGAGEIKASPLARKLAAEMGVDLGLVAGTGPGGRITKEDVLAAGTDASSAGAAAEAATAAEPAGDGAPAGELVEPPRFKRVGAARLAQSFQSVPHFYLEYEVNAGALLELRQRLLPAMAPRKLTITDMLVRAVALALRRHPLLNAAYEEPLIRKYDEINVAVAVDTPHGLAVPVVRQADRKPLAQISAELAELAERARTMRLAPDDVSGATFSLSNLGMYGVKSFTAIINPPQAGILAVGGITRRPVAVGEEVRISPMLSMTLSADHRVVDGADGARFMTDLKELIADAYALVAG